MNISVKYQKIWRKCVPLLKKGRSDDFGHAMEMVQTILNYQGRIKLDKDILIPVAMMHDIGHSCILDEHFKYITGPKKLVNGKLVHMLVGAKIAKEILEKVHYNKKKSREIIDIISTHDFDSLDYIDIDIDLIYNTKNKKLFHDFDRLDRFSESRIKKVSDRYKNKEEIMKVLNKSLELFFFKEFKKIAIERLKLLRNKI